MYIVPTLFVKVIEEPMLQEIQDHETPASNPRISKYEAAHIRKKYISGNAFCNGIPYVFLCKKI